MNIMNLMHSKNVKLIGTLAALAVTATFSVAAALSREPSSATAQSAASPPPAAAKQPENLQRLLESFRSDLNPSKVRALNQAMKLTSAEAATFWPIYQKYETELRAIDDRRIELIKQFVTLSNTNQMNDKNATEISNKWLSVQQDRLDLWKKYNTEIGKALSPIRAAQFLQVEHQISLLVDINIASEMPQVAPAPK